MQNGHYDPREFVMDTCKCWLSPNLFFDDLEDKLIFLIPKKENPISLKNIRSISLYNVLYQIITKVLANRLKRLLNSLISPPQTTFVLGRSTANNVMLAFEVIHHIRHKLGVVNLRLL